MHLGAHVPITGGVFNAPGHGRAIGADAIQIFTRNQMQWACRPLRAEESAAFRENLAQSGVRSVLTHGSYLMNLASPHPEFLTRSRDCLVTEIERCHQLGIPHVVLHPGAHMGEGEDKGLTAIARSLDDVLARTEGLGVMPLLELTAGQGTALGHRFEHVAAILDRVRAPERIGVCLDTCHVYAAGYDLASPAGYERTMRDFARIVGLDKLKAIHLNDSKRERGSRVDRHARTGEGFLGRATFARILNDRRFRNLPLVVETPGPAAEWKKEIARLRALVRPAPVRASRPAPGRARARR
ncbi:MAG TPA: deoxyribonuclease IV [Vicinamibacteria bacterium]|jgi:deoxyribonuclease-4|nr:deoxyribonuclease IV [Vicinamibacteria bacterium]